MTTNFRRFNARYVAALLLVTKYSVGVVFSLQHRIQQLITWKRPSHTMALLAVGTLVILNPRLLCLVPVMVVLCSVLVPAYLIRHPILHSSDRLDGPAVAPARSMEPATELSDDFFCNIRDVQNFMHDFSTFHDRVADNVNPRTNFSDEAFSSALFLGLALLCPVLFLLAPFVPWRTMELLVCWTCVCFGHPRLQWSKHQALVQNFRDKFKAWLAREIILDAPSQTRMVEIFELQVLRSEWEPRMFAPTAHLPLCAARISGDRPRGSRTLEEVHVPIGWTWSDASWSLDLQSGEWTEERMAQGVEVELSGERWVTDLQCEESQSWRRRRWLRRVHQTPF